MASMEDNHNSVLTKSIMEIEGRYFHGIVTLESNPNDRLYFILDTNEGTMSIFESPDNEQPKMELVMSQCKLMPQSTKMRINSDLSKKFEVQPMDKDKQPQGDLL